MLDIGEWALGQMALLGITEEDVLSASRKTVTERADVGLMPSLDYLNQEFGDKTDVFFSVGDYDNISVSWSRLETLTEVAERLVQAEKIRRNQEQKDKEEYERLKRKFEENPK